MNRCCFCNWEIRKKMHFKTWSRPCSIHNCGYKWKSCLGSNWCCKHFFLLSCI